MRTWKSLKMNDKVSFHFNDFDGSGILWGRVTEVCKDHAIMTYDGSNYWIDDDTAHMYSKGWV